MHGEDKTRRITNRDQWLVEYKKDKFKVWVILYLSNGKQYYFTDFEEWYEIAQDLREIGIKIDRFSLQFRSNKKEYSIPECDGLYLIRSALGSPGQETLNTITFGYIKGENVEKHIIQVPSMVEIDCREDEKSNCFKEAIVQWK